MTAFRSGFWSERFMPWRRVQSWRCLACGACCSRYKVVLRSFEHALLFQHFGSQAVGVDDRGKPYLVKASGRCIFQDPSGLCTLQPLGLKPVACKLWPFAVYGRSHVLHRREDASIEHGGEVYYVYVNISCRGVNRGDPCELGRIVHEMVEISLQPSKEQRYSTSRPIPWINVAI